MTSRFDISIVGAGLAGAAAALKLSEAGLDVVVLEARDRLGGRGYARLFRGNGPLLDFGGSWIAPWQTRIRGLCARFGVGLRPRTAVAERRWFRDGALHRDGPSAAVDRDRHERAIARIAADAILSKHGIARNERGEALTGVTYAAYLDRLDPPQSTRDLLGAWWTVSGNADKTVAPASELLHSSSYGGGLTEAMIDVWAHSLEGGAGLLVERMLAASGAKVERAAPVRRIAATGSGVEAVLEDGSIRKARAAIVATGLNPLRHIAFEPGLSETKARAIALGHAGRAVKIWARVSGVPAGILATGGGRGIEFMLTEREDGGDTYAVGFGVADRQWRPAFPFDGEEAVRRFFPEATVHAIDHHDWNADPRSLGAWVSAVAGHDAGHAYENWRREGRIAFAGSDFAPEQAGWFEAAAISGEAASDEIEELIRR